VASPALAGFGATGPATPPGSTDPLDPLLGWRASRPSAGTTSLGLTFEAAAVPLALTVPGDAGEGPTTVAPLNDLAGLRLSGRTALTDRVELALDVPVWLNATSDVTEAAGPGTGDLTVWAPVGLAGGAGPGGAALSVVPWVTVPTGAQARYLGDLGPGVGLQAVGELEAGPVLLAGWAGVDWRVFEEELNVRPGPGGVGGAST